MKKPVLILMMILAGFTWCSKDMPIIKMGTGLDEKSHKVTGEKTIFVTNDTIAFSITKKDPFDIPIVNARIYRGETVFDMIRIYDENIPVEPNMLSAEKSIPAWNLTAKYGGGNYTLLFMTGDTVIARKEFSVGAPKIAVIPVMQSDAGHHETPDINNEGIAPNKADIKNAPLTP